MNEDITLHLDAAISVTFMTFLAALLALAVVTYLEQRAQVCGTETFVLRLYSNELYRLWHGIWHTMLCI